jgi:hypothetical protein
VAILGVTADSFSQSPSDVLDELEPLSRALLDLSLKRGMSDAEIGGMLGTDADAVLENRVALMRSIAERVAPEAADADLAELQATIVDRVYGATNGTAPAPEDLSDDAARPADDRPTALHAVIEEPETAEDIAPVVVEIAGAGEAEGVEAETAEPQPEAAAPPPGTRPPSRANPLPPDKPAAARPRRSPLVVLLPLLAVSTVICVIVALSSGGDDKGTASAPAPPAEQPQPPASPPPAEPAPAPSAKARTALAPLAGARGRATASLDGDRLRLTLTGLPDPKGGAYQAWLYDSVADARPLGRIKAGKGTIAATLPADKGDYRYVDVSLEPPDGNPNHSGKSVLRVPLDQLGR